MPHLRRWSLLSVLALFLVAPVQAAKLSVALPLGRTAYQTNEWIDITVNFQSTAPSHSGDLVLTLTGADGSKIASTFTVPTFSSPTHSEHLHVNGWLLRPGKYTVEVGFEGQTAKSEIEVFSHLRKSSFKTINWGRANNKAQQLPQGEDSLGFNVFYGGYGKDDNADFIRGGVDFIANCVMSGGHQMDLRMECDWSDPYVTRGGTMRVVQRAMKDRTRPNVPGVHFYDEPGLTWRENPKKPKELTPHGVDAQVRSYEAAFGKKPPQFFEVDPKKAESVAEWDRWARWKLGLMDAAWKEAQFGVSWVRPDYLSLTQSQYGWTAFTDGYYFNVVRSLPITSGHGGYHDIGPGYFCPSYFVEMARARDFWKHCWYLPTWYGNTTSDQFRLEQFLSFQTNLQGLMSPPDLEPATNATARQGIVETNQLFQRLGPVFTTLPVRKNPVAVLFSLSQCIHNQTKNRDDDNYAHSMPHGTNLPLTYVALKLIQQPFTAVVEEDILDGTLANDHKAIILTSLDYLDRQVVKSLESYIKGGGVVLLTGDSTVKISGAITLDVKPAMPDQAAIDRIMKEKKYNELGPYTTTGKHIDGATPLAKALRAELNRAGIAPAFQSDVPGLAGSVQGNGDIEYVFAVNASSDEKNPKDRLAMKSVEASIRVPAPAHGLYDAILGGKAEGFKSDGADQAGSFRFGPGQMRVWARTSRPLGGVQIARPTVTRELALEQSPIKLSIAASLVDDKGQLLSGSAPLHIRVLDPLGVTRHELFRATKLGTLQIDLPLAANDPSGTWKVAIRDMLSDKENFAAFTYTAPKRVRAIAGATPRAVYFGNDRENIFRFARVHRQVTIVKGKSAFNDAAAKRLAKALEPWGVVCKEMPLDDAAKARTLTEEEAKTWCGLMYASKGQIKPGDKNPPVLAGFAVQGPVILLGHPGDNPIIKFLLDQSFLPYKPDATFPGTGRGFIAWQRDGVGRGQDSLTLIANDEQGMSEAVGSCYEAVAGIDPLTKWDLPHDDSLVHAKQAVGVYPSAKSVWTTKLPDRVLALKEDGGTIMVLTHDGTMSFLTSAGKLSDQKAMQPEKNAENLKRLAPADDVQGTANAKKQERPDRMLKLWSADKGKLAVAYWGGTLRVVDGGKILVEQQLPQDVTALTWARGKLVAGLADGRVIALDVE